MNLSNIKPSFATNEQTVLPIYYPPPIYYCLYAAVRLAILLANPKTHDWFYCNFIQLHFEDLTVNPILSDHHLNIFPVEYMKGYEYCGAGFFLQEKFIDEKTMQLDRNNLISAMIDWINRGFYALTRVDVSKLSGTKYYQGASVLHTVVFYGYDLRRKTFYHLDFNQQGNLVMLEVSFEDYEAAFFSEALPKLLQAKEIDSQYHITLCEVKPHSVIQFQLDPRCIKTLLTDYLDAINTSKRFNLFVPEAKGVFGIKVYDSLIEATDLMAQEYQSLDYRLYHALFEHKKVMVDRLKYLENAQYLESALQLPERFAKLVEMADLIRFSVMRYNINKDPKLISNINSYLQIIADSEKPLIEEIIAGL